MDRLWINPKVYLMEIFLLGVMLGFIIGYPSGLFIDMLDKREKRKNGRG